MTPREWSPAIVAAVASVVAFAPASVADVAPPAEGFHLQLFGVPRYTVRAAVVGALQRVEQPGCQQLFTEFADRAGRPVAEHLRETGQTPASLLGSLYFVQADHDHRCRGADATVAFTSPGNHVIFICGERFATRFARDLRGGEIVIIHELLHVTGLGENPPSSTEITRRVHAACR